MAEPPGLAEWLAAPLPGPAVIRLTGLAAPPADGAGAEAVLLTTDAEGILGLTAFLAAAFAPGEAGGFAPPLEPPARGRLFFPARDTYTLVWNCNRWMAEALRAAGLAVTAAGVLTREQAMREARTAASACAWARAG